MENELGLAVSPRTAFRYKDRVQDFASRPVGTYVEHEGSTVECPHCGRPALREQFTNTGRVIYVHCRAWEGPPRRGLPGDHLASYSNWRCEGEVASCP